MNCHKFQSILENASIFYILVLGLTTSPEILAQKNNRLSYYNIQKLQKADSYFDSGEYFNALSGYQKILKKTPEDTSIILKIAECYKLLNSNEESETMYSKILTDRNNTSVDARHILNFAQVLTVNAKYNEALYWYKEYYFLNKSDPRGNAGISTIENLNKLYYDTLFYVVFPAGPNTVYNEFSPVFYNDGIIFISDRPSAEVSQSDKGKKPIFSKWYYAQLEENGTLNNPHPFNKRQQIQTNYNEGPAIFYSNDQKMIFSQNAALDKNNKEEIVIHPVQLYFTSRKGEEKWNESKKLDFCNTDYSYSQPAITSDGKMLIFSSNMPGGYGGSDLYFSRLENNIWQNPVNMGENINSKGNEMFPYILNDSVLYFSSDGHGGLGGLDICYIPLSDTGQIIKMGFPVNSPQDDFGIVFDEDGMSGFLSSNRKGSKGRDDIYAFRIIRVMLTLKIIDLNTSNPIPNVEVFSVSGMDERFLGISDEEGNCNVLIPVSKEIRLRVKKEDFKSQVYTFEPAKYKTETTVVLHVEKSDDSEKKEPVKEDIKPTLNQDVTYKVQIMASRKPATQRQLKRKYRGPLDITMSYEENWHKYIIGEFSTFHEANKCLESTNVHDAFVVAYINNKRVNILFAKSITMEQE